MNVTVLPEANGPGVNFTPAISIRQAHARLLKLQREDTPTLLTEIETFVRQTQAAGALLHSDDDRWDIQGLLDYWATRLYQAGLEPADTVLADFNPSLAPELDDERCPYLGLDSFRETRRHLFFGRDRLIDEWLERLQHERLLAAIGSSGSGKSSLVLAGLVPALKAGRVTGSRDWRYLVPIVPGSNPLESLARPLLPPDVDAAEWKRAQVLGFQSDPAHLLKLLAAGGDRPCVLVVDQFEELFTLCREESLTEAFVENLIQFVLAPSPRHTAIVTMRTDFETRIARFPELQRLVDRARAPVGALNAMELRETIEKPAALVGLRFEDGVVDELIDEILGEPAGLPLLQFTLEKLWQQRERNRVTMQTYRRLGGVLKALERSAESLYEDLLEEDQRAAKRILLRMIRPGQGAEFTSNRVRRDSLVVEGEGSDRVERVLNRLIQARLVRQTEGGQTEGGESAPDVQVEVAHEALVRNWSRLADWLDEERATLRLRLQLTAAADRWEELGRHPDGLWRGKLLDEVLAYDDLNQLEQAFVEASHLARVAARRAREAARRHEREQRDALLAQEQLALDERRHAEEQAREAARLRRHRLILTLISAVAVSAWIITAVVAIFARREYLRAEEQAHIATSRQLVAQALSLPGDRQALRRLLSVAAYDAYDTFQARNLLFTQVVSAPIQTESIRRHVGPVGVVAFSPDGQMLASASTDGALYIGQLSERRPPKRRLSGASAAVTSLAFSRDSSLLALGSANGQLHLRPAAAPEQFKEIPLDNSAPVSSLAFSRDGTRLIVGAANGRIMIVDLETEVSRPLKPIPSLSDSNVSGLALSPDGTVAGLALDDGGLVFVNLDEETIIGDKIEGYGAASTITRLAFSPDGHMFAAGGAQRVIGLWDARTAEPRGELQIGRTTGVTALAFSPNGDRLVSGTRDGEFVVWDVTARGSLRSPIRDASASITSVAFTPDGLKLAVGDSSGRLALHDVATLERSLLGEALMDSKVTAAGVAFGSGQQHPLLASIGPDSTIVLWDGNTRKRLDPPLQGLTERATSLAISRDGQRLVSGDTAGTLVLWDVENRRPLATAVAAHGQPVVTVAFSPDGKKLLSTGAGGSLLLWDATTLQPLENSPSGDGAAVFAAAFSPDGHTIAWGGSNGAHLWDLITSAHTEVDLPSDEPDYTANVRSMAFSPDGAVLVVGESSGTVTLWDVAAQKQIRRLNVNDSSLGLGHGDSMPSPMASRPPPAAVTSLTFSPDGRSVASGHGAGAVVLWDVAEPLPLGPALDGHLTPVMSLAYSPDGRSLAAASSAKPLMFWNVDPHAWRDLACAIAITDITDDEREQYLPTTPRSNVCGGLNAPK